MTEKKKGYSHGPLTDEHRAKLSAAMTGRNRIFTHKHRARISAAKLGVKRGPMPEETRAKLRGQKRTPEQIERIRAGARKRRAEREVL